MLLAGLQEMQRLSVSLLLFAFTSFDCCRAVGKCDLAEPPTSWLVTSGAGIVDWATSGRLTNGSEFCIDGDHSAKTMEVDYHIQLPDDAKPELQKVKRVSFKAQSLYENDCVRNDSRIQMCFPLCGNETIQGAAVDAALSSNNVVDVAKNIQKTLNTDWAITVIQVDYYDEAAHLNASVFLNPQVWCSVYIGIKPDLGFAYLYEIQLGKVYLQPVAPNSH